MKRLPNKKEFCIAPIAPGEITGFAQTCIGQKEYSVAQNSGVTYTWSISGGGSLENTSGNQVTINWTDTGTWIITIIASTNCGEITYRQIKSVQVIDNINPEEATNLYPPNGTVVVQFLYALMEARP